MKIWSILEKYTRVGLSFLKFIINRMGGACSMSCAFNQNYYFFLYSWKSRSKWLINIKCFFHLHACNLNLIRSRMVTGLFSGLGFCSPWQFIFFTNKKHVREVIRFLFLKRIQSCRQYSQMRIWLTKSHFSFTWKGFSLVDKFVPW